jgi:ABC-2 type transport system ATP-binding protein
MQDLIRFDDVSVTFGSLVALDHVSLTVRAGEVVALIGPNGAGKSTALRVATGQVSPLSGRIEIAGLPPSAARSHFGSVPDKDNHFEEFTARRNLAFFAAMYGRPPSRIEESIRSVRLEAAADRPVREFSLGMRRRLLLARAFLHQPRVLLLDEPLANLDDPGLEIAIGLLNHSRAAGAAVLLASHRLDQVRFCDRVAIIEKGKILFDGPNQNVLKP